ncbi:CapA family protein [Halobacillus sp. GSS1]|uniref:CapA family protein n=1 Tax=Halobacillus sp. GSS1 TaxID=2815919 RepID=UPI001A8F5217|nr:CapA family protein [Halobacillus sp. GSS1]MBN9653382.1 CapA family protein [Halobacillus sp. GSS1]
MKNKTLLIILVIILISSFIGGSTIFSQPNEADMEKRVSSNMRTLYKPSKKAEMKEVAEVSLAAVGDLLIHKEVYNDAKTSSGYDFNPMFQEVTPHLSKADITFANSESIMGGAAIGVSTYPSFNTPFELGNTLKANGIDIVSMSNNHTLDRGVHAIENAINQWDLLGIKTVGSYLSPEEREAITTIKKNDITFSFLAYTYGTNGISTPDGKPYLVNRIDKDLIASDIKRASSKSDVVVMSLHFGKEYERHPSADQKELAAFAAEQGADIILGHHPHVLQPPEWIQNTDGSKSLVFYSLGNFLSGQEEKYRRIGGIAGVTVQKVKWMEGTSIDIKEPRFKLTYVDFENDQDFKVLPMKEFNADLFQELSKHMKTSIHDLAVN